MDADVTCSILCHATRASAGDVKTAITACVVFQTSILFFVEWTPGGLRSKLLTRSALPYDRVRQSSLEHLRAVKGPYHFAPQPVSMLFVPLKLLGGRGL